MGANVKCLGRWRNVRSRKLNRSRRNLGLTIVVWAYCGSEGVNERKMKLVGLIGVGKLFMPPL